jgi:hypothetical protein
MTKWAKIVTNESAFSKIDLDDRVTVRKKTNNPRPMINPILQEYHPSTPYELKVLQCGE